MELTHAQLLGFRTRYESIFNDAFNLAQPSIDKIAFVMNSGRVEVVNHRWMRGIPTMREWVGERVVTNLSTDGFTITNKVWEDTVGIPRPDIERDSHGVYDPLIARLGQTAKLHRDFLGYNFLSAALAPATRSSYTCYDGQPLFGSHTAGRVTSAQFNNVITNNPVLSSTPLQLAIAALMNRRDSSGNPLNVIGKKPLLICHTDNAWVAAQLANSAFFPITQPGTGASSAANQASAGENILKGTFDYYASPLLATSTEWYLTYQDPMFKPIIFQIEKEVEFWSWDRFIAQWTMQNQFVNGVDALYNVGSGLPEGVMASTGLGS